MNKKTEVIEEWKRIKNNSNYMVSNFGRVKNDREKILKQYKSTKGFYFVRLKTNKKSISKQVHKLILEAFDHISISSDSKIYCKNKKNSINNLEWIDNGIK